MTQQHTPGPWRCRRKYLMLAYTPIYAGPWCVYGPVHPVDGGDYAPIVTLGSSPEDEANARLIVTAVNAHNALLEALKDLTALYKASPGCDPHFIAKALDAIAKASPQAQ